jgi:signal transduction histidine kinase
VVALLPAAPIILLWILIGFALLRSGDSGPSPTVSARETQAALTRLRADTADRRAAAYAGTAFAGPDTILADIAQIRTVVTDAEGVALVDALDAAVQRDAAVLTTPDGRGADEGRAYAAVTAAREALASQRAVWLKAETQRSRVRSIWFTAAFLGGSVLAVLGGLWLSVRVMRSITSRIERVVASADAMSRNEAVDLSDLGEDEIGALSRRLMAILEMLRSREAELAAKNIDLIAINKELEAFSYSVSHDLRAPLRAIFGFSQIVEEDAGDRLDPGSLDALRRVRAAADRMSLLIDELLGLARITRLPVYIGKVDLSAVAHEVIDRLQESAAPGRVVHTEIQSGILVDGDPSLLRMVMENLLGNAWKYTAGTAAPRISVDAQHGASTTTVVVRDNGAGFDMTKAKHLFGAFQRMHTQREFEGTGVGLAIVQRLIHRHGGQVSAHAEVGRGATFTFALPVRGGNG